MKTVLILSVCIAVLFGTGCSSKPDGMVQIAEGASGTYWVDTTKTHRAGTLVEVNTMFQFDKPESDGSLSMTTKTVIECQYRGAHMVTSGYHQDAWGQEPATEVGGFLTLTVEPGTHTEALVNYACN